MIDNPENPPRTASDKQTSLSEEIFNTVREPMLVLDRNLRVQRANLPFYRHFKVSPDDTLGRLLYDLGNGQWDIPELRSLLEDVLPENNIFNDFEVRHNFEDIGAKTILLNGRRIDHLQLILLTMEDITDRKEAELALQNSMEEMVNLADSMPHLVWTARPDGTLDYVNERRKEFNGLFQNADGTWEWRQVLHPEDQEPTVAAWQAALLKGTTYQKEHRLQCQDGSYRWYLSRAIPVRDQKGHIKKWFGSGTDIDSLKKAEREIVKARQKAEAATAAKSEFLANMSHEIRTPMTIFLAALEHLEQIDNNPQHQGLLQMADKSAKHLRELIDDILDFSQIEAGHIELYQELIDLRAWVGESIGMLLPLAKEKDLPLSFEVKDEVPAFVEVDPIRLKQVLTNLIGNAIKFTLEGEVKVTVSISDHHIKFVIADTGIGIPADKQHLLFKSFSQVDSSLRRRFGGTGLGLVISKKLAELMEGSISVQSKEGEGSVFTFSIPFKGSAPHYKEAPVEAAKSAGAEITCRILLVEDDPMIQDLFVKSLKIRNDWHVDVASSGEEALEKWLQNPFEVILMDLQMSGMDGLETTRRIRTEENCRENRVCIVGLTAHAQKKVIEECINVGMDMVLTKPISAKELEEGVLRCLNDESNGVSF